MFCCIAMSSSNVVTPSRERKPWFAAAFKPALPQHQCVVARRHSSNSPGTAVRAWRRVLVRVCGVARRGHLDAALAGTSLAVELRAGVREPRRVRRGRAAPEGGVGARAVAESAGGHPGEGGGDRCEGEEEGERVHGVLAAAILSFCVDAPWYLSSSHSSPAAPRHARSSIASVSDTEKLYTVRARVP
jgi:hypothetical protein